MEAVFRHMARPGKVENDISRPITSEHKVYFLNVGVWFDPRPEFLKRLNDLGVPVKPISAGKWRGQYIYDPVTGERGAAFDIGRITVRAEQEADVDVVINPGGSRKSCGWFYRLSRKDNKWVVTQETWKWMS